MPAAAAAVCEKNYSTRIFRYIEIAFKRDIVSNRHVICLIVPCSVHFICTPLSACQPGKRRVYFGCCGTGVRIVSYRTLCHCHVFFYPEILVKRFRSSYHMYDCRREKVSLPGSEAGRLFEQLDNRAARKTFGGGSM